MTAWSIEIRPKSAKDLFSKQSKQYASSRPTYPRSLFDFIAGLTDEKSLAWDCATGNGQAAFVLADYFKEVVASDISAKQIENARQKANVSYQVFPAEHAPLLDSSVDLLTVAQALHWFDFDRFYAEAKRVLKKNAGNNSGGVIAAWTYGHNIISPAIDEVRRHLSDDILGDRYWPGEIKYVEERYETIPFPFEQLGAPKFEIELSWAMKDLVDYFHSWSSVQKFKEQNGRDPVDEISESLEEAWGGRERINERKKVTWPLYLKVGRLA